MCGIAGFFSLNNKVDPRLIGRAMARTLTHRGPDSEGVWVDTEAGVCLAHRRLAVIDTSEGGLQPMASSCGRYLLVYNGEIYNGAEIKKKIRNIRDDLIWVGRSDTEILLNCIRCLGVEAALEIAIGMFAFAVWDRKEKTLVIARDRFGEKPIYCGLFGDTFLFGSELKALMPHPSFKREIDRASLALFMRHNYIPDPRSIYSGVQKLEAGSLMSVALSVGGLQRLSMSSKRYWMPTIHGDPSKTHVAGLSTQDVLDQLDKQLRLAVSRQMVSDVSLGAFLSSGTDSSMIVALLQELKSKSVNTFTVGFDEKGYNEAKEAQKIANYLGTNHSELYVQAQDVLDIIPELPRIYDEPFADPSAIPTVIISRFARKHVTVALSGDGGDELFAGYSRYLWARDLWRLRSTLVWPLRDFATSFARFLGGGAKPLVRRGRLARLIQKLPELMEAESGAQMYLYLMSHWRDPLSLVQTSDEPHSPLLDYDQRSTNLDIINNLMMIDMSTYLPGNILVKVDRAAMSASLETRAPFLDPDLQKFVCSLPLSMKLRGGTQKWALKALLRRYLPPELIDRPKRGFSVPIDVWLRGPLKDWAEDLLSVNSLEETGLLHVDPIRNAWKDHICERADRHRQLWPILMFLAWLRNDQP